MLDKWQIDKLNSLKGKERQQYKQTLYAAAYGNIGALKHLDSGNPCLEIPLTIFKECVLPYKTTESNYLLLLL